MSLTAGLYRPGESDRFLPGTGDFVGDPFILDFNSVGEFFPVLVGDNAGIETDMVLTTGEFMLQILVVVCRKVNFVHVFGRCI